MAVNMTKVINNIDGDSAGGDSKYRTNDPTGSFIEGVTFVGTLGHGNTLNINKFDGLGAASSETLFDRGDITRESGIDNNYNAITYTHGATITGGANALYGAVSSVSTWTAVKVAQHASRNWRHARNGRHYYGQGENAFVAFPEASGGVSPDSPNQNFMYASWYVKFKYDFEFMQSFKYTGIAGGPFTDLEAVSIKDNGIEIATGTFIKVTDNILSSPTGDFINILLDTNANVVPSVVGTIVGGTSGAVGTLDMSQFFNLRHGPEKILRTWDDSTSYVFAQTWANNVVSTCLHQSPGAGVIYDEGGNYLFLEQRMDITNGLMHVYVNGVNYESCDISASNSLHPTQRMTIASVGWQGVRCKYNEVDFSDIYLSYEDKRVVFTDSAAWGTSTIFEVQPIDSWSDTSITIEQNFGALSDVQSKYCYILNGYPTPSNVGLLVEV
jgi:hypothetical protein